jgi:hypothetical protein
MHKYLLHNEFSGTTLSLPELDAAIGHVSELFQIRKVLLRSTPDDVIVVMTNHCGCPIILTRIGKVVWFPKWHAPPLTFIIDVVFLGDRLYGITRNEDLAVLDIAYDDDGVPMVSGGECVIGDDFYVWSDEEDWDDGDDNDVMMIMMMMRSLPTSLMMMMIMMMMVVLVIMTTTRTAMIMMLLMLMVMSLMMVITTSTCMMTTTRTSTRAMMMETTARHMT